ncbi:MAG TPA: hypothetical protein DCE44_22905 [Verrucomicrobiales bacterium]|nr:hypothetical protein [Verrucomicrobiales bacterium]
MSQLLARETPRLIGAQLEIQLPVPAEGTSGPRLDALLFGETQNRVVISVAPADSGRVLKQCQILGVPAIRIGTVGGETLSVRTLDSESSTPVAELHDCWWNSIARTMQ